MKKILLLVLVVAMVLGCINLIACGEGGEEGAPPSEEEGAPPSEEEGAPPSEEEGTSAVEKEQAPIVEALEVPGPSPDGIFGGRLHLVGPMNIANMGDPAQNSNPTDATYTMVAVEPLLRFDADGNLLPWLAWKYEVASDGSSITFYLREGIMFHDGTPFDADAVKYNLDIQIGSNVWPDMKPVENCEIIDKYTVRLNFKDGVFNWPAIKSLAGAFSCLMYSPTYLKNNTPEYKRTHMVGTGPFMLAEYKRDEYVKFDRFDDYWRGQPFLDGIDYKIIPDQNTQLMAYLSEEIDVLMVQAKDREMVEAEGFEVVEMPATTAMNLCLIPSSNNPDSPLADINVRRACEYAIDKQLLVDTIGYGLGAPTNQIWSDNNPCYNPDTVGYPYDPDEARRLLEDAGYEHLKINFYQVDFLEMDFPLAVQDMWTEVGIETEVIRLSILQINDMVSGPNAQGWEGWFYSYAMAGPAYDPATCLMYGPINDGLMWISCEQPEELQELANEGAAEINSADRIQIYQEIAKKMTDDYAQWLWLYYPIGLTSTAPKVHGDTVQEGTQYAYAFAWLEE